MPLSCEKQLQPLNIETLKFVRSLVFHEKYVAGFGYLLFCMVLLDFLLLSILVPHFRTNIFFYLERWQEQ